MVNRFLASLVVLGATLVLATSLASAADDLPRTATALPDAGRYTVIEALDDTRYLEFRLDRVTGQTWLYDRHDRRWQTVPCEELEPGPSDRDPRFQIVANDRSVWLVDTWGGRTWRYDRLPLITAMRFAWSTARAGDDVEGWHLVR
jgi:hypothetical protein